MDLQFLRPPQIDHHLGTERYRLKAIVAVAAMISSQMTVEVHAQVDANQFQEVRGTTGNPVIDFPGETWGAAWGDLDNDGCPDLWLGMHQFSPTGLFRNNCRGGFTNVINSAVVDAAEHYRDDTHGVAWADIDNDGDDDLIEVSGGGAGTAAGSDKVLPQWRNNLFINYGGLLREEAEAWGIDNPRARSRTPVWVDFDNNGLLDIAIGALQTNTKQQPSAVFRQVSGGFLEVNAETGFDAGSCQSVMISHLGSLGEQALICSDTSNVSKIYDVSTGHFLDLTPIIGPAIFASGLFDLAIGDFNGDLTPDVFGGVAPPNSAMAVRTGPNNDRIHALLNSARAEQGFTFSAPGDVEMEFGSSTLLSDIYLGAAGVRAPSDSDVGLNGPNRYPHHVKFTLSSSNPDLQGIRLNRTNGIFVGYVNGSWQIRAINAGSELNIIVQADRISQPAAIGAVGLTQGGMAAPIFFENQHGSLVKRSAADTFSETQSAVQTYARSLVAGDFDNDMDLDLYVGSSGRVANVTNLLFDNQGKGTFSLAPSAGGAAGDLLGRTDSVTTVDYDQDGFLDLFVTQGRYPGPFSYVGQHQLFRNRGNENHWILINLEGIESNRDGIGAVIYATTPDGKIQMREQSNGVHRYVQNHVQTHFGLAGNAKVDLDVFWPSGTVDTFAGLNADQVLNLVEGSGDRSGATQPACNKPDYNQATEAGVFLWKDCGTNQWHIRATAGDHSVTYRGSLTSDAPFLSLTGSSFEATDRLPPDFVMNVTNSRQDGIDFTIADNAQVCLRMSAPANTEVIAGSNRVSLGTSVGIPDIDSCATP